MAAQSGPSTVTTPVPVQSSSFSEFLFLPPVPENKTEPPPQSLSNFLFTPNDSTAQHAVPAVEMESSRRGGEATTTAAMPTISAVMPTAAVRPTNAAVARWSMIPRRVRQVVLSQLLKFDQRLFGLNAGDFGGVVQVADQMAGEAHERGLGCSLEQRVLERAYFLFQNGHSDNADENLKFSSALSEWPFWKRIGALSAPIFFS